MIKQAKPFLSSDFLLENDTAVQLYEQFAAPMPIIDYHNHLSPKEITENRKFKNLSEPWLAGDHYKWRAMRINGVPEKFCTGDASPFDKFREWARTVPFTMRNPLYHWTHLELKNYFGISRTLDENSAREIYDHCSAMLQQDDFRVQGLLLKMNVEVVCTTDDPTDNLEHHATFSRTNTGLRMFPSFRPDKAYATIDAGLYNEYLEKLSAVSKTPIQTFDDLVGALSNRIEFFEKHGCRSSDHGIDHLYFATDAMLKAPGIFRAIRSGKQITQEERLLLRCAILTQLCKKYHAIGWAQQFHVGALRDNNSRMKAQLGPDTGFDSIGDFAQAQHMAHFFDHLDSDNTLTRTIIYNLNPSQNEVLATMAGNFSDGSVPGKIQFGSAWWFLDQKDGMEKQINALSNMGLLSRFIGMVTDSRSFLSFPRHEYFRRILCNLIGKDVEKGELPDDIDRLGQMVQDICYNNVKKYFSL
jgi:glucuronate isomerase